MRIRTHTFVTLDGYVSTLPDGVIEARYTP